MTAHAAVMTLIAASGTPVMPSSAPPPPTLTITLTADPARFVEGEPISFMGVYLNTGPTPYALTFWWNRRMRVLDSTGKEVAPGPGPVLPSGVQEGLTRLEPGRTFERTEALGCIQPAGRAEAIGWSYTLPPGTYRAVLLFASPPKHGYFDSTPEAWRGEVESNAVEFTVVARPTLWQRLTGK